MQKNNNILKIFLAKLLFCFLLLPLQTLATAYSVSGTLSPDCTTSNTGEPAGTYNDEDYWTWTNDADTWYLFWNTNRFLHCEGRSVGGGFCNFVFFKFDIEGVATDSQARCSLFLVPATFFQHLL